MKKRYASSRLAADSLMPTASADRSRTQAKKSCDFSLLTRRGIRARVVLRHSQSSVETISRARRAFSRAEASEVAIDAGSLRSKARLASTSSRVYSRSGSAWEPMTESRDRQARSSSIHGSSSSSCRCTSRMRAVPSARSM